MEINFSSKVYSKSLLKGSVVYSLILDYHAYCGLVAFHNCKLYTWSVYMVMSDISCMIDGLPLLYWRRNLGKSGQACEIAYDFGRDRTTAQLCSCRHNATAVA